MTGVRTMVFALAFWVLSGAATAGSDAPRVFVHVMGARGTPEAGEAIALADPKACGAQILLPWRPIDDGSGHYNWTSVEEAIRPWAAAGKKVGLTFSGVDETFEQDRKNGANALATPDYVMRQVDVINCGAMTKQIGGDTKNVPPTPVYWQKGYVENWEKFIRAALLQYQDDPRIAYFRFGIGAADETFPMSAVGSNPECMQRWEAAGMGYDRWLGYAIQIIDYTGSLHPHKAVAFDANNLGRWDRHGGEGNGFPMAIATEAAKFGFLVGNEGFNGAAPEWNNFYRVFGAKTQTYMQTMSIAMQRKTGTNDLSRILAAARDLHIQVYELYPKEWELASRSKSDNEESVSARAAFAAMPLPTSCAVDPHWGR